ncbi:hypothetical protein [Bacillus cytotoxicus]|uniref:hypothetical protein n=1 Tax=Bacillus cytotoxicus TaxID=580165 RepID=UPI001AED8277|nr:hypothetical protein [Bacillus cytotoxicus]QTR88980.1 hypothetical protein JC774_11130 [Bacillus cytotoxicus]
MTKRDELQKAIEFLSDFAPHMDLEHKTMADLLKIAPEVLIEVYRRHQTINKI